MNNSKKSTIQIPAKAFATLCLFVFTLGIWAQDNPANNIIGSPLHKLILAQSAITQLYVEGVNDSALVEDAIKGMLDNLDPHSSYTPAKEVKALTEPLEGNFEGIGIQYNLLDDTLIVIQPVSGGPSEKVGIVAGDRIITVDDSTIAGRKLTTTDIQRLLRGPKGSKVNLGVMRQGVSGIQPFTVVRDKIPVFSIDAKYMVDPTTGYIRINNFGATTHEEFVTAVNELKSKGMEDLIVDLQSNGGGYLQAAVDISNEFLSAGDMIVFTEGRSMSRRDYRANGNGILKSGKVVVLTDSYTASASEILSGAIQDNDRGIIIGRRTFGKGLVQRPIELPDGSLIRLTTAHYYSPSGRCIQRPYEKGNRQQYDREMLTRLNSGELANEDSIHFVDSLKYTTLKNHRTVYGGGGIMPDIYVPLDTTDITPLYRELIAKSCVTQTCIKYVEKNRKSLLKRYESFEDYRDHFTIDDDVMKLLLQHADKAKVEYNDSTLSASRRMLDIQLKALIARDLWDMNQYYQISNLNNNIYLRAVAAIKEREYNDKLSK